MENLLAVALAFISVVELIFLAIVLIRLASVSRSVSYVASLEKRLDATERALRDEFARSRDESARSARQSREELSATFTQFTGLVTQRLSGIQDSLSVSSRHSREELALSLKSFEGKVDAMRDAVEKKLMAIQQDNSAKLEKMRETVDEKLHKTLETRLGESFKLVSERLELVQKGLGEMQSLATGVGDLKKVLSNVKTKGVLGEYQLGAILEQLLTPAQYEANVKTRKGSNDIVEFAVKIPGKDDSSRVVWLPIDAKFPTEDYSRLMAACETGDSADIDGASKALKAKIVQFAKDISAKYLDPPNTTDFAIMFLPFEGLFAEVLRIPGLFESVQRDYRITITGPTTISAFLSSLHMGFRSLAVERRTSEIWELLGAVKTEFGKFGEVLEKTKQKLDAASREIDQAGVRSRSIERQLRSVQELPAESARLVLE